MEVRGKLLIINYKTMFTKQESDIILELVSKTQISPMQQNATEVLGVLQSIIKKLSTPAPVAEVPKE